MSFFIEVIGIGAVLPAVVAALSLLVRRPRGSDDLNKGDIGENDKPAATCEAGRGDAVRGAIAIGGAVLATMLAWPWTSAAPDAGWQWLGYLAALAGATAVIGALVRNVWIGVVAGLLVCAAAGALAVPDYAKLEATRLGWQVAMGAAVAVVWLSLDVWSCRASPRSTGWLWLTIVLAGAVVLERAAVAKLAQLQGALAAALGVATLIGVWRPSQAVLRGAAGPVAVVLVGLAFNGYFETFAGVPYVAFALIMATPVVGAVTTIEPWGTWPARQVLIVRVIVVGVALGAAVVLAAIAVAATGWP